jgi:hypothetical protein
VICFTPLNRIKNDGNNVTEPPFIHICKPNISSSSRSTPLKIKSLGSPAFFHEQATPTAPPPPAAAPLTTTTPIPPFTGTFNGSRIEASAYSQNLF